MWVISLVCSRAQLVPCDSTKPLSSFTGSEIHSNSKKVSETHSHQKEPNTQWPMQKAKGGHRYRCELSRPSNEKNGVFFRGKKIGFLLFQKVKKIKRINFGVI